MLLAAAVVAVLFGAGLVALVVLLRGGSLLPARRKTRTGGNPRRRSTAALAVLAGMLVLLLTRWPVAALAAATVVEMWPRIFGAGPAGRQQLARIEALAGWTESLRDTAHAATGLEQAIPATVGRAPAVLQPSLRALAGRITGRVPLPEALARFADDLADPAADMVVAALILNARQRSGGLVRILSALAASARTELEMRRRVETERRRLRRQARLIATGVLGFVAAQAVFAPGYLQPYATLLGQGVLAVVTVVFMGAFVRMRALSEPEHAARFLTAADQVTEIASYRPVVTTR
jgi:hypothetical protein